MNEPETMPALQEGILDADTLRTLLFDIENAGQLLGVSLKWKCTELASAAEVSLTRVADLLLSKQLLGVQIRYLYAGRQWWDTLLPGGEGTRLVRIEQPFD